MLEFPNYPKMSPQYVWKIKCLQQYQAGNALVLLIFTKKVSVSIASSGSSIAQKEGRLLVSENIYLLQKSGSPNYVCSPGLYPGAYKTCLIYWEFSCCYEKLFFRHEEFTCCRIRGDFLWLVPLAGCIAHSRITRGSHRQCYSSPSPTALQLKIRKGFFG